MDSFIYKLTKGVLSLISALALGGLLATSAFALDKEDTDLIAKATADVATPAHLAGIHKQKMKLDCKACHSPSPLPNDTASDVDKKCMMCHGGYDRLAKVTAKKAKNPSINVHDSHLGPEISCTTCHQGHKESKAYCTNCHTNFDLPIPGGAVSKK